MKSNGLKEAEWRKRSGEFDGGRIKSDRACILPTSCEIRAANRGRIECFWTDDQVEQSSKCELVLVRGGLGLVVTLSRRR
jgi:hypothetical protein